jgi:hypothetical protein
VFDVLFAIKGQHGHCLVEWIDDPVLRDARFGVVVSFDGQIAFRIVRTDNFEHQIGAGPVRFLIARVVPIKQ